MNLLLLLRNYSWAEYLCDQGYGKNALLAEKRRKRLLVLLVHLIENYPQITLTK